MFTRRIWIGGHYLVRGESRGHAEAVGLMGKDRAFSLEPLIVRSGKEVGSVRTVTAAVDYPAFLLIVNRVPGGSFVMMVICSHLD